MFFRRKSLTLESIDERLSIVEIALGITRTDTPREASKLGTLGPELTGALTSLRLAMLRDAARKSRTN